MNEVMHWIIPLGSLIIATASLIYAHQDRQSTKTATELRDLKAEIDSNRGEIDRLQDRISDLEKQNEELRADNVRLMKLVVACPAPDCPLLEPRRQAIDSAWEGVERRKVLRPPKEEK